MTRQKPIDVLNAIARRIVLRMLALLAIGAAVGALLALAGCQSTRWLDDNVWPAGWERHCAEGERAAVQWYKRKYGVGPIVPFWRLDLVPDSQLPGQWAHCVSSTRIKARASMPEQVRTGNMAHENRHRLNMANGKPNSEEAVR